MEKLLDGAWLPLVEKGDVEGVSALLDRGAAEVNDTIFETGAPKKQSWRLERSMIAVSICKCDVGMTTMLVERGARLDANCCLDTPDVNLMNVGGKFTPLALAIQRDDYRMTLLLLKLGADSHVTFEYFGKKYLPLEFAETKRKINAMKALVEAKVKSNKDKTE